MEVIASDRIVDAMIGITDYANDRTASYSTALTFKSLELPSSHYRP